MQWLTKILDQIPEAARWPVILVLFGIGLAYGHEVRYVTASDFTKSYILGLRQEIRALRKDLAEAGPTEKTIIREQLERMLDELCYEVPNDTYCKSRA